MYLVIGGKTRPFLEATLESCAYEYVVNSWNQVIKTIETWQVSGRIILDQSITSTAAAAQWMSTMISDLRRDIETMSRPRVTFLNDDLSVSCWDIDPAQCVEGPVIQGLIFPKDGADIFVSGNNYSFQVVASKSGTAMSHSILEFAETLEPISGGQIIGHVGGIINPAEPQILKQYEPYRYIQAGSAVGLYGYPNIPPPIYPSNKTRDVRPKFYSPEIVYPIPQRFRVDWTYEFESNMALPSAVPHYFYA